MILQSVDDTFSYLSLSESLELYSQSTYYESSFIYVTSTYAEMRKKIVKRAGHLYYKLLFISHS